MKLFSIIARWLLAGIFLWAGATKALSPELFLTDIESFQLLPYRWAWLVSIWLPYFEITCALALLWGRSWTQPASLLIGGMLLVFIGALVSAWARGLTLSCGCFGDTDEEPVNYAWLLTRDIVLLGLAIFVYLKANRLPRQPPSPITDASHG